MDIQGTVTIGFMGPNTAYLRATFRSLIRHSGVSARCVARSRGAGLENELQSSALHAARSANRFEARGAGPPGGASVLRSHRRPGWRVD